MKWLDEKNWSPEKKATIAVGSIVLAMAVVFGLCVLIGTGSHYLTAVAILAAFSSVWILGNLWYDIRNEQKWDETKEDLQWKERM